MIGRYRQTVAVVATGIFAIASGIPVAFADDIRAKQWHLAYLHVTDAQRLSEGDGVVVAVVDSGVNGQHPDLAGNVLPGVDVSNAGGTNGQQDRDGHGTGMAGLIAAHGHDNADGVLGIAPHAKIYPIKDTAARDVSDTSLIAGINAAIASEAKIISISQGTANSPELRSAIDSALAHDIVVVAGVGNKPEWILPADPAAYPGVLAVGATDQNGDLAAFSATGTPVALTAPGTRIVSTDKTGYRIADGTSDSTAIVAGAAALVRSKFPNLSAPEVIHRLEATATDKGPPGRDPQYGYGIVNIVKALTADVPPLTPSASPAPGSSAPGTAPGRTDGAPPVAAGPAQRGLSTAAVTAIGVVVAVVLLLAALLGWRYLRRRSQAGATGS